MRSPRQSALARCSFRATKNAAQAITSAGGRQVLTGYDAPAGENPGGYFDPVSGRFTAREAGFYQFDAAIASDVLTADNYLQAGLFKNGAVLLSGQTIFQRGAANAPGATISTTLRLNPGDYVQISAATNQANTNAYASYFSGHRAS